MPNLRPFAFLALSAALLTAGCSSSSSTSEVTGHTVSGVAIAGPVDGAVTLRNAAKQQLATGTVTAGQFQLNIPDADWSGELDFEVTGSYSDEVSGDTVQLTSANPLALRVVAAADLTQVAVTPESSVIRAMVEAGSTLDAARNQYQATFGSMPSDSATPFDPTTTAPVGVAEADERAAFMLGVYSQWAADLGLSGDDIAQLPAVIGADLADGALDGVANGTPLAINATNMEQLHLQSRLVSRYLTAMATFAGSAANGAGLAAPTMGLPSSGVTDEATATRTLTLSDGSTLSVELSTQNVTPPFPATPTVGRNLHRVTLSDASGAAVDLTVGGGLKVSVMMHMLSGKSHASVFTADYLPSSDPANGLYDFDIYYLMASNMVMNGSTVPMGIWDVTFTLTEADGVTTHVALFHPNVIMAMDGSGLYGKVTDAADSTTMNGSTTPRPYFAWLYAVTANVAGGYDLDLTLSSKQSMMSFPLLKVGTALGMLMDGSDAAPYIEALSLRLDLDGDAVFETVLTDNGDGHFSAPALNLVAGADGFVQFNAELQVSLDMDGDITTAATDITFSQPILFKFKLPTP